MLVACPTPMRDDFKVRSPDIDALVALIAAEIGKQGGMRHEVFDAAQTPLSVEATMGAQVPHTPSGNPGVTLMNFIIWLIVGGVIGWLASMLMKTNDQQGIILNVIVGISGAMLAGWFVSPLVGMGTINQADFSVPALLISFVGAAALLAIIALLRRGRSS